MQEFERARGMGRYQGMDAGDPGPAATSRALSLHRNHDLEGALYDPTMATSTPRS
jgi:dimethylglycine dehydrogenase